MAWVKRNLYFVICVAIAIGLAGFCGYLFFASLSDNAAALDAYNTKKASLDQLTTKNPAPSQANIEAANDDVKRVSAFLEEFHKPFSGFPKPPKMDDREFHDYLQKTISQFGLEATNASVALNPGYGFGFQQQAPLFVYRPEYIASWLQQIEEIRAILHICYKAKINFLEGIKRPSVGDEDMGPDIIQFQTNSTPWGTVSPYMVTFRAFSAEIANVLAGVATSSNCFIVKAVYVTPSKAPLPQLAEFEPPPAPAPVPIPRRPTPPAYTEGGERRGPGKGGGIRPPQQFQPQPTLPTPAETAAAAAPVTILRETPLFVTVYIDVVKLKVTEPVVRAAPAAGATPRTRPPR